MIEEFLYVQSPDEQVIPVSVALRCVKALEMWRRKKDEDTLTNIKHVTVLILK